jgi:hypothetical protein
VLLAVKVTVLLVLVLAGLKAALTPAGSPEALRLTEPVKPPAFTTVIVTAALALTGSVRLALDAERVKLPTVTPIVVLPDFDPELPFTLILYCPGAAVVEAARVNMLVVLVESGLKLAVMPLGKSDAERVTGFPEPSWLATVMMLVAVDPRESARLSEDGMRLRFDADESCIPDEHPIKDAKVAEARQSTAAA